MLTRRQRLFAANNGGGNLRRQLLDGAPFLSELLHTAVPTRAAPGTTGTFTRATTKTVENNDGYLVTLASGEIGFPGARRVRNYVPSSENFAVGWTLFSTTLNADSTTPPEGITDVTSVLETTDNFEHSLAVTTSPFSAASTQVQSFYVLPNGRTKCAIRENAIVGAYASFNLTGSGSVLDQSGATGSVEELADGWYRIQVLANQPANAGMKFHLLPDGYTTGNPSGAPGTYVGDVTKGAIISGAQWEDVTAQTTQTAGEYVSVGVESAPYYHGSMVDGVKCFPTDLSGNPIPSTTMLGYQAEGARTNLILSSDDLTNGVYWSASGSGVAAPTVTVGQIDQAGTTKALKLDFPSVSVATNFSLFFTTSPVAVTASPHSNSWRLKGAVGGEQIYISGTPDGVTYLSQLVTLTDEWVDYELVGTPTAANWYWQIGVDLRDGGQSAKSAQTVYVCFPQLELGSFASSYIPTTTVAVTRDADVLTYSSAGNIDGTKGWCYAEYDYAPGAVSRRILQIDDGTEGERIQLAFDSGGNLQNFAVVDGGVAQAVITGTADSTSKSVGSWAANDFKAAFNGVPGIADTSGTTPTVTTIRISGDSAGVEPLFGTIRNVRIGQRQLSASELQAITS